MPWGKKKVLQDEANVLLEIHLQEMGFPFSKELRFHPSREWRFDYVPFGLAYAVPGLDRIDLEHYMVAIEIEGGIHTGGRHVRGRGYEKDLEKYREAAALGWKVYRFSTQEVLDGTARAFIQKHCSLEE